MSVLDPAQDDMLDQVQPSGLGAAQRSKLGLASVAVIGLALLAALPHLLDLFALLQVTLYAIFAILALSLAFVLGYGGILCLGQAVFFGLGAYTYAIGVIDIGDSTLPVLLAVLVPALFAAALGYFIFFGRITEVYVGVITLTVGLIFYSVVNSTADPKYAIGAAAIGGFNGMPNVPGLNVPFNPDATFEPVAMFYLSLGALLLCYFGLRVLLATRFGRVLVAVRENERRAELIGYDVRLVKLQAFTIGAAIAGLAGCLFVSWGSFVGPSAFSIIQSAQVLIWVLIGGSGTLIGPMLGAVLLSWLTAKLGMQQTLNASMVLGAILLVFVLVIPSGLLPAAGRLLGMIEHRLGHRRRGRGARP